jgi:hypothetical protein
MRAILLARATITGMGGLRANIRASHDPWGAPRRRACRVTALAPMISRRRSVRSPLFEIAPNFCLPPVERSSGVNPSQVAKSRPLLKGAAVGDSATRAVAVIGPMPGIVASRGALPSSRALRAISTSSRLMLCSSDRSVSTS